MTPKAVRFLLDHSSICSKPSYSALRPSLGNGVTQHHKTTLSAASAGHYTAILAPCPLYSSGAYFCSTVVCHAAGLGWNSLVLQVIDCVHSNNFTCQCNCSAHIIWFQGPLYFVECTLVSSLLGLDDRPSASQRCSILRYTSCLLQWAFYPSGDAKGKRHITDLLTQLTQQSLSPRGLHCLPAALHTCPWGTWWQALCSSPHCRSAPLNRKSRSSLKVQGTEWTGKQLLLPESPFHHPPLWLDHFWPLCERGHLQLRHTKGSTPGDNTALGVVRPA